MSVRRPFAFGAELPAWMEALRDRAGPLLPAALELARWKGPDPFPDGHAGIRRLGKLVDELAFDDTCSEVDDARFVEAAGSMLGLLLVAHVGLGRHRERDGRHVVELGALGFFDPFGAIDAALDAPRPSAELASRIAAAEAEAHGEGPVAKTTAALLASLERAGSTRRVRDRFEALVSLDDGVELDLGRFVALAGDEDADLAGAIDRFVRMLSPGDSSDAMPWADAAPRLLPRLASVTFLESLRASPNASALASRAVAPGLVAALVLEFDGRLRFVREREVEKWRSEGADPFAHAATRLDERSTRTRWSLDRVGETPCAMASRGDGLAATLVLSHPVRRELARQLGDSFVVALPHRDRLVATRGDVDLVALRAHAEDEHRRAPHRISACLFRVTSDAAGFLELLP